MSSGDVVFTKDGYTIEKVVVPKGIYNPQQRKWVLKKGEIVYNVGSPEGQLIFGNRSTLGRAKRDLGKYIRSGGKEAAQEVPWKGSTVNILSSGGDYDIAQLDKEIRDLVLDLNYYGYQTTTSCAGHYGLKRGFINFAGKLDADEKEEVRRIFKEHSVEGVRFGTVGRGHGSYTQAEFPSLG